MLEIDGQLIEQHGAVSKEVVREMAIGVLKKSGADLGLAITGIAGPEGGTPEKPVGTVWISGISRAGEICRRFLFHGSRAAIRRKTAVCALLMGESLLLERPFPDLDN